MSEVERASGDPAASAGSDFEVDGSDQDAEEVKSHNGQQDNELVLPPEVGKRVKALKKIQVESTKIEAKFFEEMHLLECKYLPLYKAHFDKRKSIVGGEYEPTEEECDFVEGSESETEDLKEKVDKMAIEGDENREKVSGIPEFWLTIFRNVDMLAELVEPHDEPILKHLTDIKIEMSQKPMGFRLFFYFSPNEYFTNTILTKSYEMKCEVDPEDPFSFEGPEIYKCVGCPIDWKEGKNVTVKTVKKKQKHKQLGSVRVVTKTVDAPSFFTFFNPPQVPEDGEGELDEETQLMLTNDFELGEYIRETIVPRAVLYFTGEALEDDDSFDEEEEEDDEDDDDEADPAIKFGQINGSK